MRVFSIVVLFIVWSELAGQVTDTTSWQFYNKSAVRLNEDGRYNEALDAYDISISKAIMAFGLASPEYVTASINKTYTLNALGRHLKAVEILKSLQHHVSLIYKKPHVLQMDVNYQLARSHLEIGNYDSTDLYINSNFFLYKKIEESNKPHFDTTFFEIVDVYIKSSALQGTLFQRTGQFDKAITTLEDLLDLIKVVYPDKYQQLDDYRTAINNLGTYYNASDQLLRSKEYALQYLVLIEKYGDKPVDKINALQNLGSIYSKLEHYDSAYYFLDKALVKLIEGGLEVSRLSAIIHNNIGTLYLDTGQAKMALDYFRKAKTIQERRGSLDSYIFKNIIFNLAEAHRNLNQYEKADQLYATLIEMIMNDVAYNFSYLSDEEKISFYQTQLDYIEEFQKFALEISGLLPLQKGDKPYIKENIGERLYNLQLSTKGLILNNTQRMRAAILGSNDSLLVNYYHQWESLKKKYASLTNGESDKIDLSLLNNQIENYEKWLTSNSRRFRKGFSKKKVVWEDIKGLLKDDEACVEIIRMFDGLVYMALIITPNSNTPSMTLVRSSKGRHLEREYYQNYYNAIQYKQQDTLSYQVYWKPIIDKIIEQTQKMPTTVYVSKEGIYNQININTLYDDVTGNYVLDETDIVVVSNSKEVMENSGINTIKRSAILMGNPDFESHKANGISLSPLPGSENEVKTISQLLKNKNWDVKLYLGDSASEGILSQQVESGILHLATHGFFIEEENNSIVQSMLNSGVVLSDDNLEDGILTAYELTTHNFDSTQLAILSACETGLGKHQEGEGMYGLQRALQVAGINNIIMSLWMVDDEATSKLMEEFYLAYLDLNNIRKAFYKAQIKTRERYPEPYYWGAFILTGR